MKYEKPSVEIIMLPTQEVFMTGSNNHTTGCSYYGNILDPRNNVLYECGFVNDNGVYYCSQLKPGGYRQYTCGQVTPSFPPNNIIVCGEVSTTS